MVFQVEIQGGHAVLAGTVGHDAQLGAGVGDGEQRVRRVRTADQRQGLGQTGVHDGAHGPADGVQAQHGPLCLEAEGVQRIVHGLQLPAQQLNGQGDDPLLRFGPRIGLHALLADGIDTGRRELTAEPVLHAVRPDPGTNESGQTVMLAHDLTDGPTDERAGMDAAPGEQDIRHGRPPAACTPSGRNRRPADSGRGRYGRAR